MKISSKRISKLRRTYGPRASRVRLRLTDKRIRRLERERIRSGRTFEAVWRSYRPERIRHSAGRIAKKYGLSFVKAKELRKLAIKTGEPVKETFEKYFYEPIIVEPLPPGVLSLTMSYESLYNTIRKLQGFEKAEELPDDFVLSVKFGPVEFIGSPEDIDLNKFKAHGDIIYKDESPWWGHLEIVQTVEKPRKSFFAVISEHGVSANVVLQS